MIAFLFLCITLCLCATIIQSSVINNEVDAECNLPANVIAEINSYRPQVNAIVDATVHGQFKGATYNHLAEFIDRFCNRIAGSANLENAIDYMLDLSRKYALDNVHGEEVVVPHWVRGDESATLITPRVQDLPMLGLGSSIGTPLEGITAPAIVVTSFDDLKNKSSEVKGKIVVYEEGYVNYGVSVAYRSNGASAAAKYGAVATLIRSVTPFSLRTPHTGWQDYEDGVAQIPTACITVEDARMLKRMQDRGEPIQISLRMSAKNLSPATSRNTVADLRGTQSPEKVVVVSGHLDSWDVGEGAMDDGGGALLAWSSVALLKALNFHPRRTIRAILWTAEEEGIIGAQAYVKRHQNETNNFNFVMESDIGTFTPLGLMYNGVEEIGCILKEILKLTASINTTQLQKGRDGPDIQYFYKEGIPGASLLNQNDRYFWFHHSAADTMDVEDPQALDKATALWASVSYIIADLSTDMPKNKPDNEDK